MISGMLELLTAQGATGWAYNKDEPSAPLLVRARDHEELIAQIEFRPQPAEADRPSRSSRDAHAFFLPFPHRLDEGRLLRLSVETALPGTGAWTTLPRYPKVGSFHEVLALPSALTAGAARDATIADDTAFWSRDGAWSSDSHLAARPVFVVGAARSGTTALSMGLAKGTKYKGFPEGHVLDIAIRLANAVNTHFEKKQWMSPQENRAYHFGRIPFRTFQDIPLQFLRSAASGFTTPFWFDKTPTYTMIASVPLLAEAWPESRFIFMKRRGLENVGSRLRKFTSGKFTGHCKDWAMIMSAWRSVRDAVPGRFLEVDQRTLALDPESVGAAVGALLGLDSSETTAFAGILRDHHPEATGPSSDVFAGLRETGWSSQQIEIFRETCHAEMEAYGYTYDGQYQSPGAS